MDIYLSDKRGSQNLWYYLLIGIVVDIALTIIHGALFPFTFLIIPALIIIALDIGAFPFFLNTHLNFVIGLISKILGWFGVPEESRFPIEDFTNIGKQVRRIVGPDSGTPKF